MEERGKDRMKALYKKVGERYYQVNRNLRTPINISRMSHNHTALTCGCNADTVGVQVWIETMDQEHPATNRKLANMMVTELTEKMVTQIDTLENNYKVYLDYTITDDNGKELEHSVSLVEVKPTEAIRPLGVNRHNECIYRQVDLLKAQFELVLKSNVPFGIMCTRQKNVTLHINDVVVLQEFAQSDELPSIYSATYKYGSPTIQSTLENMINIYSTKNEGICLEGIDLQKLPRKILIDFEISLADTIVVYDNEYINHILEENYTHLDPDDDDTDYNGGCGCEWCEPPKDEKPVCPPKPPTKPECNCKPKPPIDHRPPCEIQPPKPDLPNCGCKPPKPDEEELPTNYWRCSKHTVGALKIVPDCIPDTEFDERSMIKKCDVLQSIPDIEVGDYVIVADNTAFEDDI